MISCHYLVYLFIYFLFHLAIITINTYSSNYPIGATVVAAGKIKHSASCGEFFLTLEQQRPCFHELDGGGNTAAA